MKTLQQCLEFLNTFTLPHQKEKQLLAVSLCDENDSYESTAEAFEVGWTTALAMIALKIREFLGEDDVKDA
jgi:hypothetical protein